MTELIEPSMLTLLRATLPSMKIIRGRYRHQIGTSSHVLCSQVLSEGSEYELADPSAWHSVEPLGGSCDSIMMTGRPYPVRPQMPEIHVLIVALTRDRFDELICEWQTYFVPSVQGEP